MICPYLKQTVVVRGVTKSDIKIDSLRGEPTNYIQRFSTCHGIDCPFYTYRKPGCKRVAKELAESEDVI